MRTRSGAGSYMKALLDPELWLDTLCSWLMAVGLSRAFDQLFDFHATWAQTLVFTLLVTTGLALLTRKAWVLPLLAAGELLICVTILLVYRRLETTLVYWAGFFQWWFQILPPQSSYNTPENRQMVIHLVQLAIGCGAFFSVRRIRSVVVLGLTCLAFFIIVVLSGFRENIPAMAWILAGLLPLLARNTARSQNKGTRLYAIPRPDRRPKGRRMTPLWPAQLSAVAVCAVVSLLVGTLLPEDTTRWVSDPMRRWIGGWEEPPLADDPPVRLPMELEGLGLAEDARHLGGPLGERSDKLVLFMTSPIPVLLKGTSYGEYTGRGWDTEWDAEKSGTHYFWDNQFFTQRLEAFDRDKPVSGSQYLFDQVALDVETEVTMLYDTKNLLVSGGVESVAVRAALDDNPLWFNNRGELFLDKEIKAPFTYNLRVRVLPRFTEYQRRELAALASAVSELGLEDRQYDRAQEAYLQLPDSLPERVRATAREAVRGKSGAYEQAEALEAYLSSNFRYTESPSQVPGGRDFVDYFLETGEGYCVYFASAMAVMARTLGIPSRFVCGFGVERTGLQEYAARGYNAHAWVECYIEGIGWVTFDPTASSEYLDNMAVNGNTTGQDQPTQASQSQTTSTRRDETQEPVTGQTTASQIQATEPGSTASGEGASPGQTGDDGPGLSARVLPLVLAAGLLVLMLAVMWRLKSCADRYRLERVRQRYPDRPRQAEFYYQDFLRQAAMLGYVPLANETMKQFAQRVLSGNGSGRGKSPSFPVPACAESMFRVIMDWRYGQREPTDQDIAALAALREELEQAVRAHCGAIRYFFLRRLGLGR